MVGIKLNVIIVNKNKIRVFYYAGKKYFNGEPDRDFLRNSLENIKRYKINNSVFYEPYYIRYE